MALIGAKMRKHGAEGVTPKNGIPAIARMAEIERACHVGNVPAHKVRITAENIASEDQCIAAAPFVHIITVHDLHP